MKYKKVKVKFDTETRDYLQFRRFVDEGQAQVLYRAPDTDAGRAILDRRRKR